MDVGRRTPHCLNSNEHDNDIINMIIRDPDSRKIGDPACDHRRQRFGSVVEMLGQVKACSQSHEAHHGTEGTRLLRPTTTECGMYVYIYICILFIYSFHRERERETEREREREKEKERGKT